MSPLRTSRRRLATLLAAASLLAACNAYQDRNVPADLPADLADAVNADGARIVARHYPDPQQAETAFGFDIRGAGLFPVRLTLDNRSRNVVQTDPQQTFLVDMQGQAWPLLTSGQAYNRAAKALDPGNIGRMGKAAAILGAAGGATGFALGVLLSSPLAGPVGHGALIGAGLGLMGGGAETSNALEERIRKDLNDKALRNQRIQPGDLAHGVLFFPGEAGTGKTLRLSLLMDGYPRVVNVPLKATPAAPAAAQP